MDALHSSRLDIFIGKAKLQELGLSKVFDLRSDTEIRKYNTPLPVIDGVEILHTPVFQTADYSPEMMAKCVRDSTFPVIGTPMPM